MNAPAWQFQLGRVTVALYLTQDYGYQYDGDDPDGETQAGLDSGELVAFDSQVRVMVNGHVIGTDSLGGSVYGADEVSEFYTAHRNPDPNQRNTLAMKARKCVICHYFPDMVREAIADARRTLGEQVAA